MFSTADARSSREGFGPAASTARAMMRTNAQLPVVAPYAELVSGSSAVYFGPPAAWYSRLHISPNSFGVKFGSRNAPVGPAAMIFVPCKDGISHNEIEDATKADVGAGCQILLQAMVERANA